MPLPAEESLSPSAVSWRLFAGGEAVNASAMFNFRESVPEKVADMIQGRVDARSMSALYIPLLAMPQDSSLFIALLDSLANGKLATPACYEPSDVMRVLIARANDYVPIAVTTMRDYFCSMGYVDRHSIKDPALARDEQLRAIAEGWCEVFDMLQGTARPATKMQEMYEEAGISSVVDALLAGVPEEDLFA